MSVNALKPNFTDREGYLAWRKSWRLVYRELSRRILVRKEEVAELQRQYLPEAPKGQRELHLMRRDATKMMTLLDEAKLRRDRIIDMARQIAEQPFPLEMVADRIDFYFNKGSIEFQMLPPWIVKAKGRIFYVQDFISEIGFSTKNKPDGPTRGLLRFRKGKLLIDDQGVARLI
jgi:hypothetical protein